MPIQITNVPTRKEADAGWEIVSIIKGAEVKIVKRKRFADENDWIMICSIYIGDHWKEDRFTMDELRTFIANEVISTLHQARDIGYNQAKREVREALLGVER